MHRFHCHCDDCVHCVITQSCSKCPHPSKSHPNRTKNICLFILHRVILIVLKSNDNKGILLLFEKDSFVSRSLTDGQGECKALFGSSVVIWCFFYPPPRGGRGILLSPGSSGCPSVRPSVRASTFIAVSAITHKLFAISI